MLPKFYVSKASATTSTTNANTVSNNILNKTPGDPESSSVLSIRVAQISLPLRSPEAANIGPSSITAKVNLSTSAAARTTDMPDSDEQSDLLGLLEKYDKTVADTEFGLFEERQGDRRLAGTFLRTGKLEKGDVEIFKTGNSSVGQTEIIGTSVKTMTVESDIVHQNEEKNERMTEDESEIKEEKLMDKKKIRDKEVKVGKDHETFEKDEKEAKDKEKNTQENNCKIEQENERRHDNDDRDPKENETQEDENNVSPETMDLLQPQNYQQEAANLPKISALPDTSELADTFELPGTELPETSEFTDTLNLPDTSVLQGLPESRELDTKKDQIPQNAVSEASLASKPKAMHKGSLSRVSSYVDPKEQHQLSHLPFDFNIFLDHLKTKTAEPIVRYTKSFLASFTRQANHMNSAQMMKAVGDFQGFISSKFMEYPPFLNMDESNLENSREGMEKLIMNCLYNSCFSPASVQKHGQSAPAFMLDDLNGDQAFSLQVEKFSWILGVHLDVDLDQLVAQNASSKGGVDYMEHARKQLNKINEYRAPRDKIICVLNACKVIFSLLKVNRTETNADEFIPLLILVILRAKTPNFISNIRYISRFRGSDWLNHGETSYYLSTIEAAVNFIHEIKFEDLTIEESHYNAHMEAWEADLRQKNAHLLLPIPQHGAVEQPERQAMAPSSVLMTSPRYLGKSLSSFLSLPSSEVLESEINSRAGPTEDDIDRTLNQLMEIFSELDQGVLRDVIIMNNGDFNRSLDACLQLVGE